jgi:branched-chain amino acid transport system permease protein
VIHIIATSVSIPQHILDALSSAGLYSIFALSIALIFGIIGLVNFAQGGIMMGVAYALLIVGSEDIFIKLIVAVAVAVALSLVVDRVAFRPIRHASPTTLLVTSFMMAELFQAIAEIADNDKPRATLVSSWLASSFRLGGGTTITRISVITIAASAVLVIGLAIFMRRASIGVQMRASAENFRISQALGIRSNRVIAVAFGISGVLAGVSTFLFIAQSGTINPTIGTTPLLFGFVGTVIGGLGSLPGAVAGGFILGALTEILEGSLPPGLTPYTDAFVFGAVFLLLVTRPQGMFGTTEGERV